MRNPLRRQTLKALGVATITASGTLSIGPRVAAAATRRYVPEAGASVKVLRWKRFVQGDEDQWMDNTRRFTAHTGVAVQVESVNGEDLRPKGAMAANIGAGPDILIGPPDMPHLYPDRCVDLTTLADYLGRKYGGLPKRHPGRPARVKPRRGRSSVRGAITRPERDPFRNAGARSLMRFLMIFLLALPAYAGETVLDNDYVRVTRNAAPCASAAGPQCAYRVIVALDDLDLDVAGARRHLARGDIAVFTPEQTHQAPAGVSFFEVAIKPRHPRALPPGAFISPQKNAILYESADFFVFEEKLEPGDTRARHSHSQRVVIQLNQARLQQWPDGEAQKIVETAPELASFSQPVVHTVKNIGDVSLRGIIIEFKPR